MANKFSNRARLNRKLGLLPQTMIEEARKGLAGGADKIVATMKNFAPVRSGRLRDSITWTWGDKKVKYSQGGGKLAAGALSVTIRISAGNSKVRYPHIVEFGAKPHAAGGKFKGAAHPGERAQPFFYPGYRVEKKAAKARIRRASKKGAQLAARKS